MSTNDASFRDAETAVVYQKVKNGEFDLEDIKEFDGVPFLPVRRHHTAQSISQYPGPGTVLLGDISSELYMIEMIDIRGQLDSIAVRDLVYQLDYPAELREKKTERILSEYRENVSQSIFGAHAQGELVGFIGFFTDPPDRTVIRHIAVRRDYRRQGIGTQMILHVYNVCGLPEITAETDHDAVEFYRRVGFKVISLGEKYPRTERFFCSLVRSV